MAGSLGVLTGLAEILPRYRDDPWAAAFCRHGIIYWLINGFVSLLVFFICAEVFTEEFGLVKEEKIVHQQMLKLALLAGVGAMALMRSKLFKITLKNGDEYSVGPDHIINALLVSTNEYIDRYRGQERAKLAREKFKTLDYGKLKAHAQTLIFGARQTLPKEEETEFANALAKIENQKIDETEKAQQIGFKFIDYLGEKFVRNLVFGKEFDRPPPPVSPPLPAIGEAEASARKALPIRKLSQQVEPPAAGT